MGYRVSQFRFLELQESSHPFQEGRRVNKRHAVFFWSQDIFEGIGTWAYGYDTETGLQDATKEGLGETGETERGLNMTDGVCSGERERLVSCL